MLHRYHIDFWASSDTRWVSFGVLLSILHMPYYRSCSDMHYMPLFTIPLFSFELKRDVTFCCLNIVLVDHVFYISYTRAWSSTLKFCPSCPIHLPLIEVSMRFPLYRELLLSIGVTTFTIPSWSSELSEISKREISDDHEQSVCKHDDDGAVQ